MNEVTPEQIETLRASAHWPGEKDRFALALRALLDAYEELGTKLAETEETLRSVPRLPSLVGLSPEVREVVMAEWARVYFAWQDATDLFLGFRQRPDESNEA